MPRHVDHDQRRRDILRVTGQLLAEQGMGGLSFRTIAGRLGGSTTLVTHYFSTQTELLDGFAQALLDDWDGELAALEVGAGPEERLAVLLHWLVPTDAAGIQEERARIVLLGERILSGELHGIFAAWDQRIRHLIRDHLTGLVPAPLIDLRVDVLRTMTNGLVLSVLEHPDSWSADRIQAVIDCSMADMGLRVPVASERTATRA